MIATHLIKFFLEEEGDFSNAFSGFTTHPGLWAFDGFTPTDAPPPTSVAPTPTTSAGGGSYRYFGWIPEKKKKPVVEVAVQQHGENVEIKYVSVPAQPDFPIEVFQSIQEALDRNQYRKKALQRILEELEEEEDIKFIVSQLH